MAGWSQEGPLAYLEWEIAQATGWTLEYIDALPVGRLREWQALKDARAKANDWHKTRLTPPPPARRR